MKRLRVLAYVVATVIVVFVLINMDTVIGGNP